MTYPNAITYPDERSWLSARMQNVGASEAPAVLGTNPYASALNIYAAKVEGEAMPDSPKLRAGRVLERGILELWAAGADAELQTLAPRTAWALPEDHLGCTPDVLALRAGKLVAVEAKNVGPHAWRSWGEGPPLYYVCQVQVQLGVLRANGVPVETGYLSPFFGGDDVREYEVPYDDELFALVRIKVRRFWQEHIEPKIPPPPDKFASADDVRRCYRKSLEGKRVEVPRDLIARKVEERACLKVHEDAMDQIDRDIMDALKDAEIGTVDGIDVVSWKAGVQQRKAQEARTIEIRPLRLLKAAEGMA